MWINPKNNVVFKQHALLFLLGALTPLSSAILIPLHINYFSPYEYGLLYLIITIATFCNIFSTLSINTSIKTYYFDFNAQRARTYIQKIIQFSICCSIVFFSIYLVFGDSILGFVINDYDPKLKKILSLAILSFLTKNIVTVYQIYITNARKSWLLIVLGVSYFIIFLCTQAILIVNFSLGITSVFYAMLLASIFCLVIILIYEKGIFAIHENYEDIIPSLKYGIVLIPFILLEWMLLKGDKWIVQELLDLETLGVYALTMNIAFISSFVSSTFLNASRPEVYRLFKKQNLTNTPKRSNLILVYFVLTILSCIGIYCLSFLIYIITSDSKFIAITSYLPIALCIIIVRSLLKLIIEYFECFKLSKIILLLSIFNVSIFVIFAYYLPQNLGIKILFVSLLTSNLISLCLGYIIAVNHNKGLNYV